MEVRDGAYDIYREGNSRYLSVTFNVRGRDLGSAVEEAMSKSLPEVRAHDPGAFVLKNLEHRNTNGATLSRRQASKPIKNRLASQCVLVELQPVQRTSSPMIAAPRPIP